MVEWVAAVVGIPYRSCKQVGVMVFAQELGTAALLVKFVLELDFWGTPMILRGDLGRVNLKSNNRVLIDDVSRIG